jgi:hypothetical protein
MGRRGSILLNLLTLLVLLGTCTNVAVAVAIFLDPYTPLNPFPPPPSPTSIAIVTTVAPPTTRPAPSSTFTPVKPTTQAAPTTPAPAITPSETPVEDTPTQPQSNEPTSTPTPSLTPSLTPTATEPIPLTDTLTPRVVTPTKTRSPFPFTLQDGGPAYGQNFANSAGCNWMGIAGQAFDLQGNPLIGLIVSLQGGGLDLDSITGSKTAYGSGGYEFFLNDRVVQTTGEYKVQLLDGNGSPLSPIIPVNTFADCTKNLILVNFVQNH